MIKKSKHELSFLCDLSIFFFLFDFPFFNESILNLLSFCPLWFLISFTDAYFDISFGNYFFKIKKKKEKKIPKTTKRETCINGLSSAIKCKQRDIKQLSRGLLALNVDCWENMLFDINNLVFYGFSFVFSSSSSNCKIFWSFPDNKIRKIYMFTVKLSIEDTSMEQE